MTSIRLRFVIWAAVLRAAACARAPEGTTALTGDWDYYRMLGAEPSGAFDGLRRFGFAHFESTDTAHAYINRRLDTRLERIRNIEIRDDSVILTLAGTTAIRARSRFVSARQSIFHDAQHASYVRLPLIPENSASTALTSSCLRRCCVT